MKRKILLAVLVIIIVLFGYCYLIRPTAIVDALNQSDTEVRVDMPVITGSSTETKSTTWSSTTDEVTDKPSRLNEILLAFGQSGYISGVQITPQALIEDSRCPTDVNCIQAGLLRLRVSIKSEASLEERTFVLGKVQNIFDKEIVLQAVTPARISTKQIKLSDYLFNFVIK